MNRSRRLRHVTLALAAVLATAACGKKGPPLPPLVLLPAAPGEFAAVRRGDRVDLTFRVPDANTDRSTPADLARVDIYAWTVPAPVNADDIVRRGTRIGSVAVNPPPDPDEPPPETPAPRGNGIDQRAVATFAEALPSAADESAYRVYVAVGVNLRGRRGALSPRIAVPLVPAPPAPAEPRIAYDEKAITVTWPLVTSAQDRALAYTVYRPGPEVTALTSRPIDVAELVEEKFDWDKERCYEVRTAETVEGMRIESDPSPEACVTPRDTFAPAAPEGLVAVGSEGAVSLIWNASPAADLAGYLVLRAIEPATELVPVTPAPIADANFRDTVPSGARATYAVQAVDKAGNRSEASARVTESAR